MNGICRFVLPCAIAYLLAGGPSALAQEVKSYPSSPIRIIIPTPSGGANDILARMIGQKLTAAWGQPVIVESRPGASGMIAASAVAKAPADGYTLLLTHAVIVAAVALRSNPGFSMNELAAVAHVAHLPIAFSISASTGATSLGEFVRLAKANPKKWSFGSYGTGTSAHVMGEMLNRRAGIDLLHVPYKGEAPAIIDLLGGQVTAIFGSTGAIRPYTKDGKVVVVAVGNPRRSRLFPDAPTFAEAGYPDMNIPGWAGVLAPAATPKAIVNKLAGEIASILRMPDVTQQFLDLGFEPTDTSTPQGFSEMIEAEVKKWQALGKETQISLD